MQSFKSKLFQNENNMRDVKDILDEAQESMDMAIMYLDEDYGLKLKVKKN